MTDASPGAADPPAGYAGPNVIPSFRDIADLERLGVVAEPHRLRLGMDLRSRPPSPLFNATALPQRVVAEHTGRIPVPGPEYYGITGHELGSFGLLQQRGRVFVHERVQPRDLFQADTMPRHWIRGLLAPGAEVIECDTPIGVALNPHLVWGHFLLEMLARVHLLAKLRTFGRPVRMAVPSDAPAWVREFVALYFSAEQTVVYESEHQRVRAPCFVLPSMMMAHYHLHPMLNAGVQELLDRVVGPVPSPDTPRKLYLSRSRHPGWHTVENEAEVEATLADLGFAILHPQELTMRQQLTIFAGAECIVSQYSSAAHNALFAPLGTPVFCFGWMNRCQSGIAALRGQPLAYMRPSDGDLMYLPANYKGGALSFRIDCRELARQLPAFLRFADAHRAHRAEAASRRGRRDVPKNAGPLNAHPGNGITAELLAQAPWQYGRDGAEPSTASLQFLPDGQIGGYQHPNERRWSLRDGVLSICNAQGGITARFDRLDVAAGRIVLRGPYLPDSGMGIVLRLERAVP